MAMTQAEIEERRDAVNRRAARTGVVLLLMMPVTIALTILALWWLTAPLR